MRTLLSMLSAQACACPQREAFVFHPEAGPPAGRTWGALATRARAIAAMLRAHRPDARRALLLFPSGIEYLDAIFACAAAGIIAIPAYPPDPMRLQRSLPRLEAMLRDCRADFVLTTEAFEKLIAWMPEAQALRAYDVVVTDAVPDSEAAGWSEPGIDEDAPAIVQYTSGSTRSPRGVVLRHRDIVANVVAFTDHLRLDPDAVSLMWLPLYHDMGLIGGIFNSLHRGGTCHLLSPVDFLRRPSRWVELLSATRAEFTGAPNFAYELAARKTPAAARASLDLSCLAVACTGAEPVRVQALASFADAFAIAGFRPDRFMACYGLAEATLFVSGSRRGAAPARVVLDAPALERGEIRPAARGRTLVSHGSPPPGHRIVIVDTASCAALGSDCLGEIWVATPGVAAGYLDREAETADTFQARLAGGASAFLRTGDQGFFHEGELYLTGRLKDLVILRGKNLYPHDLEATAEAAHPALRPGSSAAFAVETGETEELVLALEVSADAAFLASIASAVRAAVIRDHDVAPAAICLLAPRTIPKTSSGKIQRGRCREALLSGELQVLHRLEGMEADSPGGGAAREAGPIDAAVILDWLVRWSAQATGAAPPEPGTRLSEVGIDSLGAATLLWDLEVWLGETVPVTIAVGDPTLEELCASIAAFTGRAQR